ncbi:MAG TPA: ABC transporter permease [Candidatus Saccharimonadales bacterium]|nr:ABC transporter permease [Candidatus Saccharimonadales bacterium]
MTRRDPLLPNAGIVARREYRDRVRSPLFVASTFILMALALGVALAPIAIRYLDRQTVDTIVVISSDEDLALRTIAVADSIMNQPPPGADPSTWARPYAIERGTDGSAAQAALASGRIDGVISLERNPDGGLAVEYLTYGPADTVRLTNAGFTSMSVGILDWTSSLPPGSQLGQFQTPEFTTRSLSGPTEGGQAVDAVQVASRSFLGTVFIILMFITILIYGMWVATGVATEKSSRVMELMISAASPRQLLLGKVAGIGGAGLTQYAAIAIPAVLVLAFQEPIAGAILGSAGAGLPTGGLTVGLLVAYGAFFLMGFALFAFVYAAVGSFVSRPDDLQTLSLPLSLIAMAGYFSALLVLLDGGGWLARLASFVPPLSPFAMLARLMVSNVQPWEVVLSVAILLASIVLVALFAIRVYATGVLLYGQRPGLRAFIAAGRKG